MPEVVIPPYFQSVLALRPPAATSTRTDLAPSFKLLQSTVNLIYGVSGIRGLEPGLWRAQLIRITTRSAQLIEAIWTQLGGQTGVAPDDPTQGGVGVMKLQSVFSDLQIFISSIITIHDPLSAILLDPVAFSRTQLTVTSLSKKLYSLIHHYKIADLLPTPLDQWAEEDAGDKEEDLAAIPILIAKSRPNRAVLQSFQDSCTQRQQAEASSSPSVDIVESDTQTKSHPPSLLNSSVTSSLQSLSHANSGLSSANRSDFLRFVYSQNPNLISKKENVDSAIAAGNAALSSMTPSSKVSSQLLSQSQDGHKPRKSLVQQRISSFASLADGPPPLPSSTLNPLNPPRRVASDNPNDSAARKGWAVDMRGLNGIQRQASLKSSTPSSHPGPSARILVASSQPSWKPSTSRSASLKSRSSSFASAGEPSDSKHKSLSRSEGKPTEYGHTAASPELDGTQEAVAAPTIAEQAAAIVAKRKQRAILQSSSPQLLPKERLAPAGVDESNSSNRPSSSLELSPPDDKMDASGSIGAVITAPKHSSDLTPSIPCKSDPVPERDSSSNSDNVLGSDFTSTSSTTSPPMNATIKLPENTVLTGSSSSVDLPSSSILTQPTPHSNADLSSPSPSSLEFIADSSLDDVLNTAPRDKPLKTSFAVSHSSSSLSSPTSPNPLVINRPSVTHAESSLNVELVPDLVEHASFLDAILAPSDFNVDHSSTISLQPVESDSTISAIKPVHPPRSPNRLSNLAKPSVDQPNVTSVDESSLADLMEQASMFENWTPDLVQVANLGREPTPSIGSTIHPQAPNDSEAIVVPCTISSPSLSPHGSSPQSPLGNSEPNSQLMRSPVSLKPSSTSLKPIDLVLTSLPEGNHSSTLLSLAGSTSSTPSASAKSWATSLISNSPILPDLDLDFFNANHALDQLLIPPPKNPLKAGWRILCLDGGGVRGLSMLYFIRELMSSIQAQQHLERTPLPCEIFEMICGVGTGGIIALLLGRLRLDATFAITAYLQVVSQVFGHSKGVIAAVRGTTRFSASRLEAAIQQIVKRISGNPELPLNDEVAGTACRTFVISTRVSENKGERDSFLKLRSYSHGPTLSDTCSIAQAARATSAAPLFFKPPKLNDGDNHAYFVPTGITVDNPSLEAAIEAQTLFPGRPIDCLVSLGAGSETPPVSGSIARACLEMVESSERTAKEVVSKSRWEGWSDKYFRFAVKGLNDEDKRGEWQNADLIKARTASYIFIQERDRFHKQVEILSNSWSGAYEDEVMKSLKVDNNVQLAPHSATLPARSPKLSTEPVRRSISQAEMRLEPKTISSQATSQASVSVTRAEFKRPPPMPNKFSTPDDAAILHGLSVQTHLGGSSQPSFLSDLQLPAFDFSQA